MNATRLWIRCAVRTERHLRQVESINRGRRIAGSVILVMVVTLGSTLLGFVRELLNARYFGTQWEMDTFLAAATIPTIIFGLFNGALVSALIPTFSHYVARGRDDDAWRLGNTVLNGLAILLVAGSALGWLLAPIYVPLIAHGFPAPQMGVAIRMTRWLMPSVLTISLSGVVAAILNSHSRFLAPAFQGIAINLVTIATVVVAFHALGIYSVVLGTTLGFIAQLIVQLPAFLALGRYRFEFDLRHPGLRQVGQALGPIIVGSAAGQLALLFDRSFASTLSPGYISGMNYAVKVVNFPQQIFITAIATVIFPLFASEFARRDSNAVRRAASLGLRIVMFITIPSVCGLIALRVPIVETLFEGGNFTPEATVVCAQLLPFAAVGLIALAANVILTRCCFACGESRSPVAISVATVLANVALSLYWLPSLGARGLLLANSVSQSLQAVALLVLVHRLIDGVAFRALAQTAGKTVACSAGMLLALFWISSYSIGTGDTVMTRILYLVGQLALASAVFFTLARLIRVEELDLALRLILDKFRRHVPSASEGAEAPIA
jgi:putative peptidoglycan lipid II flippase